MSQRRTLRELFIDSHFRTISFSVFISVFLHYRKLHGESYPVNLIAQYPLLRTLSRHTERRGIVRNEETSRLAHPSLIFAGA